MVSHLTCPTNLPRPFITRACLSSAFGTCLLFTGLGATRELVDTEDVL